MHSLNSWKTQIYKSMLSSVATAWVKTLIMPGKGGGGVSTSFIRGGFIPRSYPLPSYIPFLDRKGTPSYPLLTNGTPFTYRVETFVSLFFVDFFTAIKRICQLAFLGFFNFFFFTDFTTLSYNSTREISTLSYTWSLKKVPLSGGASPYKAIMESNPPPRNHAKHQGWSVFLSGLTGPKNMKWSIWIKASQWSCLFSLYFKHFKNVNYRSYGKFEF